MSREWKPGDVAMVKCSDGEWRRAAYFLYALDRPSWVFPDNTRRRVGDGEARPLVDIDPEDLEQLERLVWAIDAACVDRFGDSPSTPGEVAESLPAVQAALRSLIAPPKPEEPQGLGAVVEDADGVQWVRVENRPNISGHIWASSFHVKRPDRVDYARYDEIAAVSVLADGATR